MGAGCNEQLGGPPLPTPTRSLHRAGRPVPGALPAATELPKPSPARLPWQQLPPTPRLCSTGLAGWPVGVGGRVTFWPQDGSEM